MTVIVYRDEYMAADSRVMSSEDFLFTDDGRKIYTMSDGSLLGCSGGADVRDVVELFYETVADDGRLPTRDQLAALQTEFEGLLACSSGDLWHVEITYCTTQNDWAGAMTAIREEYAAVGSGAIHAYGALAMGASATQAVEATIKHNASCGGNIDYHHLDKRKAA